MPQYRNIIRLSHPVTVYKLNEAKNGQIPSQSPGRFCLNKSWSTGKQLLDLYQNIFPNMKLSFVLSSSRFNITSITVDCTTVANLRLSIVKLYRFKVKYSVALLRNAESPTDVSFIGKLLIPRFLDDLPYNIGGGMLQVLLLCELLIIYDWSLRKSADWNSWNFL